MAKHLKNFQVKQFSVEMGQLHRIGNSGNEELVFVEIQTGTYFR